MALVLRYFIFVLALIHGTIGQATEAFAVSLNSDLSPPYYIWLPDDSAYIVPRSNIGDERILQFFATNQDCLTFFIPYYYDPAASSRVGDLNCYKFTEMYFRVSWRIFMDPTYAFIAPLDQRQCVPAYPLPNPQALFDSLCGLSSSSSSSFESSSSSDNSLSVPSSSDATSSVESSSIPVLSVSSSVLSQSSIVFSSDQTSTMSTGLSSISSNVPTTPISTTITPSELTTANPDTTATSPSDIPSFRNTSETSINYSFSNNINVRIQGNNIGANAPANVNPLPQLPAARSPVFGGGSSPGATTSNGAVSPFCIIVDYNPANVNQTYLLGTPEGCSRLANACDPRFFYNSNGDLAHYLPTQQLDQGSPWPFYNVSNVCRSNASSISQPVGSITINLQQQQVGTSNITGPRPFAIGTEQYPSVYLPQSIGIIQQVYLNAQAPQ